MSPTNPPTDDPPWKLFATNQARKEADRARNEALKILGLVGLLVNLIMAFGFWREITSAGKDSRVQQLVAEIQALRNEAEGNAQELRKFIDATEDGFVVNISNVSDASAFLGLDPGPPGGGGEARVTYRDINPRRNPREPSQRWVIKAAPSQ